jgi:hypothetical protein
MHRPPALSNTGLLVLSPLLLFGYLYLCRVALVPPTLPLHSISPPAPPSIH